jgi:hypothetical protein
MPILAVEVLLCKLPRWLGNWGVGELESWGVPSRPASLPFLPLLQLCPPAPDPSTCSGSVHLLQFRPSAPAPAACSSSLHWRHQLSQSTPCRASLRLLVLLPTALVLFCTATEASYPGCLPISPYCALQLNIRESLVLTVRAAVRLPHLFNRRESCTRVFQQRA